MPIGTESWILVKGAINEPQRSEVKLVVFLVWNPGLLIPCHGSFCGIILLALFIEMFLMMPQLSSISFGYWCCHPQDLAETKRNGSRDEGKDDSLIG